MKEQYLVARLMHGAVCCCASLDFETQLHRRREIGLDHISGNATYQELTSGTEASLPVSNKLRGAWSAV
jgi:hypothetical protein